MLRNPLIGSSLGGSVRNESQRSRVSRTDQKIAPVFHPHLAENLLVDGEGVPPALGRHSPHRREGRHFVALRGRHRLHNEERPPDSSLSFLPARHRRAAAPDNAHAARGGSDELLELPPRSRERADRGFFTEQAAVLLSRKPCGGRRKTLQTHSDADR